MKLAMILGKKQGDTIKPRLQNIKDNLNIDVFDDVAEFVYSVSKRNTIYDRILVLATKINPSSLKELNTCWGMYSKETAVVMLSRKGTDEEKAKAFLNVFKTPVACAMLVSSTTVQIIAESVLRPVVELNNEYGLKDFLAVEIEEDEFAPPEPPKPVQPPAQQPKPAAPAKAPTKKKRGGLFSGIFGSRGPVEEEPVTQGVVEEQQTVQQVSQPAQQVAQPVQQSDSEVQETGDDFGSSAVSDEEEYGYGESAEEVVEDDWDAPVQPQQIQQVQQQSQPSPIYRPQHPSEQRNSHVNPPAPSSVVDETFEDTLEGDLSEESDFAPDSETADVDFGTEGTLASHPAPEQPQRRPSSTEQADENFGDVNIAAAEAQYRIQKEAPKVITRTVREPVLGSGSAIKGVYSGRLKKILIVTGDRGTGVTCTALNIAQTLAKKVEVLYFDCDTDNHGLLNYLDYTNFKSYEPMHMTGVQVCRSSQVFDKCVISWDDNLSILTSDFSCDCKDEELQTTAEVVAERAMDFGVVVVDCPASKLPLITDLILTGQSIICVEGSKRGFMNMLCRLEASPLHVRYKRNLVSKGSMFITKCPSKLDVKKLLAFIKAIYQPSDVDWLSIRPTVFNGKLSEVILNSVLEG